MFSAQNQAGFSRWGLLPALALGTFQVFTTVRAGGAAQRLEAGTREALRKTFPRLFHPPRVLDGLVVFAVTRAKK